MQIKNIFFPLPVVVDLINENGEEERKILFFDQIKKTFLPIDTSVPEEDLNLICQKIINKLNSFDKKNQEYEQQNLMRVTDLKKMPEFVQKIKEMKEGHLEKLRKD